MNAELSLSKNSVIAELTRSSHGDLEAYAPTAIRACEEDPNFFAHLVAWNDSKGKIRDAKVALPILAMKVDRAYADQEFRDNAFAHVLKLNPRELLRAVQFGRRQKIRGRGRLNELVREYLREREQSEGRFLRTVVQHRKVLKALYVWTKLKPAPIAQAVLFDDKKVGILADLAGLQNMSPMEAAGTIVGQRIPFLPAMGALGAKAKDPDVLQALIAVMSPTELVTNSAMLNRLGVATNPALRASYDAALKRAASSAAAVFKTSVAADKIEGSVSEKLRGVQEKQLDAMGVEGDWAVLADKSGSMSSAISLAQTVAATLARVAKGKVYLIFFDYNPYYFDVTNKSLDEIQLVTKRMQAMGGTNAGCTMSYLQTNKIEVDGVALVSDGGENGRPVFAETYKAYCGYFGKDVPVTFYRVKGDRDVLSLNCHTLGVPVETFDLQTGVDYHSLPNMVLTMRTNRFSLVDEIMGTPLLRLEDVLKSKQVA